jgi:hypothetical protein
MYAWTSDVQGVEPYPGALFWNIQRWTRSN